MITGTNGEAAGVGSSLMVLRVPRAARHPSRLGSLAKEAVRTVRPRVALDQPMLVLQVGVRDGRTKHEPLE